MRKFIKQKCVFLILAIICLNLLEYVLPYHYGNKNYSSKLFYLKNNESKFNALFFGSSKTDYSIYPPIIDSVLSDKSISSILVVTCLFTSKIGCYSCKIVFDAPYATKVKTGLYLQIQKEN